MKIIELTNYSAGICGVWARVKEESLRLSKKGHEVIVFSSDFTKGSSNIEKPLDKINKVKIYRFKSKKLGGESFMKWDYRKAKEIADRFKPEIIIAHSYRHPHTLFALKLAKRFKARAFLVTHAPFIHEANRTILNKIAVRLYDNFFGASKNLKKFDKIITITHWEIPFLKKLGANPNQLNHIPNGIPELFFTQKKKKESRKLLFLGRLSPIKDIETLIKAITLIKDKSIILELVGPAEKDYKKKLNILIKKLNLEKRIKFSPPIYDISKKIEKIDSSKIFILPSKSEAMPQSLIEAMAREKVVISSDNLGSSSIISDNNNGFLFKTGDCSSLAVKINLALQKPNKKIKKQAKESVKQYNWSLIIDKLENLIRNS